MFIIQNDLHYYKLNLYITEIDFKTINNFKIICNYILYFSGILILIYGKSKIIIPFYECFL